jgi:hypothetical protein
MCHSHITINIIATRFIYDVNTFLIQADTSLNRCRCMTRATHPMKFLAGAFLFPLDIFLRRASRSRGRSVRHR